MLSRSRHGRSKALMLRSSIPTYQDEKDELS